MFFFLVFTKLIVLTPLWTCHGHHNRQCSQNQYRDCIMLWILVCLMVQCIRLQHQFSGRAGSSMFPKNSYKWLSLWQCKTYDIYNTIENSHMNLVKKTTSYAALSLYSCRICFVDFLKAVSRWVSRWVITFVSRSWFTVINFLRWDIIINLPSWASRFIIILLVWAIIIILWIPAMKKGWILCLSTALPKYHFMSPKIKTFGFFCVTK